MLNLATGEERRLTDRDDPEFDAVYSPDGTSVLLAIDSVSPNQGNIDIGCWKVAEGELEEIHNGGGGLSHQQWPSWSPYEIVDPDMKRTYSGAESGQGAIYEWDGDGNVGQGRMEILEADPGRKVKIKLDFIRPFEGHNTAEFRLEPATSDTTNVTWAMYGPQTFMGKVMCVFIDVDGMIGRDFDAGLAKSAEHLGGNAGRALHAFTDRCHNGDRLRRGDLVDVADRSVVFEGRLEGPNDGRRVGGVHDEADVIFRGGLRDHQDVRLLGGNDVEHPGSDAREALHPGAVDGNERDLTD